MSFATIAAQRALSSVEPALGALQWDVAMDDALRDDATNDLEAILKLLIRRGLEPALVSRLFDCFPARPLERALLAWDVLHSSLLGPDDTALVERMTSELAPLTPLATHTAAVPRDNVPVFLEVVRSTAPDPIDSAQEFLELPNLAGLGALTALPKQILDEDTQIVLVVGHASILALAHFPSLAIAFMHVLRDRFPADPRAQSLMAELALDHDLLDAANLQSETYIAVRTELNRGDLAQALAVDDRTALQIGPDLLMARVELALLQHKNFDATATKLVAQFAPPDSGWRYAARIRDSITAQFNPHQAAPTIDRFIARFGNDAKLWRRAAHGLRTDGAQEARSALLALLSRELRYVSHDPHVWRALAAFSQNGAAIEAELDARLHSQLTAALRA